jgi:hypothetical protein
LKIVRDTDGEEKLDEAEEENKMIRRNETKESI